MVHGPASQKGIVLRELSLWLDPLVPSSKPLLWSLTKRKRMSTAYYQQHSCQESPSRPEAGGPCYPCGSPIGKGGCMIKEIRESTGAQVQVAGEMLSNSAEQAVTIAGTPQSTTECVTQVGVAMLDTLSQFPPKGCDHPILA